MEKVKENKKVVIVFILLLIMLSLGVSYAYWLIVKTQTNVNIISSACLKITFTGENDIKLTNAYPMDDEEIYDFLTTTTPYHFTIINECEEETNVVINLETLGEEETKLGDQYMDVILYNGEKSFEEILMYDQLNTQIYSKSGDGDIWDYRLTNNLENSEKVLEEAIKAYRLYEFTLKGKESKSFNLIEYMSQDTPALEETMNKEFLSKITVSTAYSPPATRNMLAARMCSYSCTEREPGIVGESLVQDCLYHCTDNSDRVFQDEYIENTTKIVFTNTMNVPSTYVASYDESGLQDGSIIAYVIENEEGSGTYTIEFQTDGMFSMESGRAYFYGFYNVTEIEGLRYIDTSSVTEMDGMFYGMRKLTELDVSSFDTSNVTNMSDMFYYMISLQSLDLSKFDTSNVTDMHGMFSFMESLTELDVSNFDTSNVIDMESMFYDLQSLTELDLSNFDTSNVTDMSDMFANMYSLPTLDLSNFDTSNVIYMESMFTAMSELTTLDISNFNTSNVTDMVFMFAYDSELTNIIYGDNFIYANSAIIRDMYYNCPANKPTDASWDGVI